MPKNTSNFKEKLGSILLEFFRLGGVSFPATAYDRLTSTGKQIASIVEQVAEEKAVSVIKKLQNAVFEGFSAVEVELNTTQKAVRAHQRAINNITTEFTRLASSVNALESLDFTLEDETLESWDEVKQELGLNDMVNLETARELLSKQSVEQIDTKISDLENRIKELERYRKRWNLF